MALCYFSGVPSFFVCMDEHCAIHRAFVCLCTLDCTPDAPNAPFGNADFTMFLEVPEKLSFGDAPYCTFAVFSMHPRCTQFDS